MPPRYKMPANRNINPEYPPVPEETQVPEKFVDEAAAEKYDTSIRHRELLSERGFLYHHGKTTSLPKFVQDPITVHNWEQFCHTQPNAIIELVREFYTNYKVDSPNSTSVRGFHVSITPDVINDLYNLPTVRDQFKGLCKIIDMDRLNEILTCIALPNASWTGTNPKTITLSREMLKPEAKVWYYFLLSRLLPSTHDSLIQKKRAILLYCILEGKSINVGELIHSQLQLCAKRNCGKLWFPSLITRVCKIQGVPVDSNEPTVNAVAIVDTTLNRITKGESSAHMGGNTEKVSTDQTTSSVPHSEELLAKFDNLEKRVSQMEVMQYEAMSMMHEFYKYTQQRDIALEQYLKSHLGQAQPFPDFPTHIFNTDFNEEQVVDEDVGHETATAAIPEAGSPSLGTHTKKKKGKLVATPTPSRKTRAG